VATTLSGADFTRKQLFNHEKMNVVGVPRPIWIALGLPKFRIFVQDVTHLQPTVVAESVTLRVLM
jgi:hypothetical protein